MIKTGEIMYFKTVISLIKPIIITERIENIQVLKKANIPHYQAKNIVMEITDPFILDVGNGNCLGFASTSVANNSQMDKIRPQLNSSFPQVIFFYITMPNIKKKLTKYLNVHRIILWYLHSLCSIN